MTLIGKQDIKDLFGDYVYKHKYKYYDTCLFMLGVEGRGKVSPSILDVLMLCNCEMILVVVYCVGNPSRGKCSYTCACTIYV